MMNKGKTKNIKMFGSQVSCFGDFPAKKLFFIILVSFSFFLISSYISSAQEQSDTTKALSRKQMRLMNPEGTEFWLCFEKNYKESKKARSVDELQLELFITGDDDANVNIEIDGIGFKQKVFVPGGTVQNVKIPSEAQVKSEEIIERLAVHLTSDKPVNVYGLNRRFQTTDTYLGFPVSILGTEYRPMCYTVSEGLMPQFAIIATDDFTEVTITPTVNTVYHRAGVPFMVKMKKGDVYQVVAKNEQFSNCDLTGSMIKSNKKIALFSGHQCAYVTPKIIACNHLVEQIPPITSWGKHFYIGKLYPRSKYTYRVLANEPETRVFSDTKLVHILNAGEFYDSTVNKNIQITANKPILVAQYSQGFKNGDSIGDPMMLLISPTQQFLRQYRFATPINGFWKHMVNVIAPTQSISTMMLDGRPIDPNLFEPLGLSRYSIAFINIQFGSHLLEGKVPFGMYSYGFGYDKDSYDAYGTMGGQSFVGYEQTVDVNPPMADDKVTNQKLNIIFHDDRVDDLGIKDITVVQKVGMDASIPKIEEGVLQVSVPVKPVNPTSPGKIVFKARDLALNFSYWTVCYAFDGRTGKYKYQLSQGIVEECMPDPGIQFGVFGKLSFNFHSADFSSSGNVKARGKFGDAQGIGGYGGILAAKRITPELMLTGRLYFENYGGTLQAPDSTIQSLMYPTAPGVYKDVQMATEIKLSGLFMNLALGGEYYVHNLFYGLGGLNVALTLSDAITYKKTILKPDYVQFPDKTRELTSPGDPTTMGSLNTLRIGVFAGVGLNVPINYNFSAFAEGVYNYYISNMISDGNWGLQQISILAGIRYRL